MKGFCFVLDCRGIVVVLLFQDDRISGHSVLHSAQEGQSGLIPARLPPCHNVSSLVDWNQVGAWWTV